MMKSLRCCVEAVSAWPTLPGRKPAFISKLALPWDSTFQSFGQLERTKRRRSISTQGNTTYCCGGKRSCPTSKRVSKTELRRLSEEDLYSQTSPSPALAGRKTYKHRNR